MPGLSAVALETIASAPIGVCVCVCVCLLQVRQRRNEGDVTRASLECLIFPIPCADAPTEPIASADAERAANERTPCCGSGPGVGAYEGVCGCCA